jgi:hypothetical protein
MEKTKELKPLEIYNSLSRPPREALREIQAGKLKGKTDINPQWRYKAMTETFGLAGQGWKYEVQKLWTEPGAGTEKLAFAQVAVFVKTPENTWSEPIVGIGGSKLVAIEKGGPVSNDEGYKMAVTDAFSTALKMIGVAADIYAGHWDGTKYRDEPGQPMRGQYQQPPARPRAPQQPPAPQEPPRWSDAQLKEMADVLNALHLNGEPVFTAQDKEVYNKFYKNGVDFQTSLKQAKDTLALRLKEATPEQRPPAPQEPPADIF